MLVNKVNELVEVLGIEEVEEVNIIDDMRIEIDSKEYLIVTEDEREEIFRDYERNLIEECGIECFSEFAKEYIIDNCLDVDWFNVAMEESNEGYIDNLDEEELKEYFEEYETEDIDELKEKYNNNYEYKDDAVQWFRGNFGNSDLTEVIKEHDLLDVEKVIDYIIEVDGYVMLATYDGKELETDNYYAYRTN